MNRTKKQWRDAYKRRRSRISLAERKKRSERIRRTLCTEPLWNNSNHIATYVSYGSEVETHTLIETAILEGKNVYVPRCQLSTATMNFYRITNQRQLQEGYKGILEPNVHECAPLGANIPLLMIVPGLVFDLRGGRIGYGGGYYDRFLQKWGAPVTTVAVAFHFQIVTGVLPMEETDIAMDWIISDQEIVNCEVRR